MCVRQTDRQTDWERERERERERVGREGYDWNQSVWKGNNNVEKQIDMLHSKNIVIKMYFIFHKENIMKSDSKKAMGTIYIYIWEST